MRKIVVTLCTSAFVACTTTPRIERSEPIDGRSQIVSTKFGPGLVAPSADCQHDEKTFRCVKIAHVYDGDTITAEIDGVHPLLGHQIPVRVRGVDSPEIYGKHPCEKARAAEARDFVTSLLAHAKRVDLADVGRDKYFRIDAVPIIDGVPLPGELLKRNLAYPYGGGAKKAVDWCLTSKEGQAP